MFKVNFDASIEGTCLQGYAKIPPSTLKAVFGEPRLADCYKVTGEWVFQAESGRVFTLYDYKQTSLYWHNSGFEAPTPEEFWSLTIPVEFDIGGQNYEPGAVTSDDFIDWLLAQIKNYSPMEKGNE